MDRDKVIKGIRKCLSHKPCSENGCPYENECAVEHLNDPLLRDALAMLKEQEAVAIKKTKEHGFGVYGGICPKCRNWIQSAHSFCGFCGQAVKWNDLE